MAWIWLILPGCLPCFGQSLPQVAWHSSTSTGMAVVGGASISTLSEPSGPFAHLPRWNSGWLAGLSVRLREGRVAGGTAEIITGERRMTELLAGTGRPIVFRTNFVEAPAMARVRVATFGPSIEGVAGFALGVRFHGSSTLSSITDSYKDGIYVHALVGANVLFGRLLFGVRYERALTAFAPARTSLGNRYVKAVSVTAGLRIR